MQGRQDSAFFRRVKQILCGSEASYLPKATVNGHFHFCLICEDKDEIENACWVIKETECKTGKRKLRSWISEKFVAAEMKFVGDGMQSSGQILTVMDIGQIPKIVRQFLQIDTKEKSKEVISPKP